MSNHVPVVDLTAAKAVAQGAARHWGLVLGEPFSMASVSYVAPTSAGVLKVAWEGDEESLHEPEALLLWDGEGAVKLIDRHGSAILEQRALPGSDLSALAEADATAIAVDLALTLWRPACPPFRPVAPEVSAWIARAGRNGSELAPLAAELLTQLAPSADWVVHGDSTTTTCSCTAADMWRSIPSHMPPTASTTSPRISGIR